MSFVKRHADWLVSLGLIAVVLFYAARFLDFNVPPFEDAAMLMRYADHLAHGYGIVWNIGEHPVDGATDFLFMVASAALIKLGVPVGRSVRAIGFGSHLLTVLLVYWVNRKLWKANIALSFLSSLYLAVGTGLSYVVAFFGTPFFALSAAITWTLGLILIKRHETPFWPSALFALSGLVTGLIRPEGVILAGLMLMAVIVARGWRRSVVTTLTFAGVFAVLGGGYFLWRWNYFGYPLPNPYYVKGSGLLHWDSFRESFRYLAGFGGPFLLAFLLGLRSRRTTRLTIAFLIPPVLFAGAFILISNQTNFGGRFQYALWPLILLSWYPLVDGLGTEIGLSWPRPPDVRARSVWILVALALTYGLVRYSNAQNCFLTSTQQTCSVAYESDGRYDAAQILADYRGKGYVIATSEAGLLPFYSGWTAVDTWGLNDQWIAHHGGITEAYLDRYKPNVIMFHGYFSPLEPPRLIDRNLSQDWFRMTITLKDYAESHGYILAAAFGDSPYEAHYYYVRPDFPDSSQIVNRLQRMRYDWFLTGRKALNYAEIGP